MPTFRTRFSKIDRVGLACTQAEKRTKSEFAKECDINVIMARYRRTGVLPESALASAARFGDFSQIPTFQEMQDKVIAAHELFSALPAQVRDTFQNDPALFIEASGTPEGQELMVKLGLAKRRPTVSEGDMLPQGAVPAPAGQAESAGTEPAVGGEKPPVKSKSVK